MEKELQKVDIECDEGGEEEYELCDPLDPECIRLYEKIKEAWLEYIRKDKEKKEVTNAVPDIQTSEQDIQDKVHPIESELDQNHCNDIELSDRIEENTKIDIESQENDRNYTNSDEIENQSYASKISNEGKSEDNADNNQLFNQKEAYQLPYLSSQLHGMEQVHRIEDISEVHADVDQREEVEKRPSQVDGMQRSDFNINK